MKAVITSITLLLLCIVSQAQTTNSINGIYFGKNLYIQAPASVDPNDPCILEIRVNGDTLSQKIIGQLTFEINISSFGIKVGDSVRVKITSRNDCLFKVLNPDVLIARNTFNILSLSVRNDTLYWTATHEKEGNVYDIEQYRWNKWLSIGMLEGTGSGDTVSYKFRLDPHSGKNYVRVRWHRKDKFGITSRAVNYNSNIASVNYKLSKDHNTITFSSETRFELYDHVGNALKKGIAKEVDISPLAKGAYYLNFDNSTKEIRIRKRSK